MSQPPSTYDQAHLDKDIGNLVFVHQRGRAYYGEHQLKLDTEQYETAVLIRLGALINTHELSLRD